MGNSCRTGRYGKNFKSVCRSFVHICKTLVNIALLRICLIDNIKKFIGAFCISQRIGKYFIHLPGYGLPIRGNFLLNLLTAAMRQETLRFSARDYRGITYVREAVERLTQAMELPGGVYNFGSENDCDMATTARRACALLDIHPVIEAADWPRSLLMDGGRFRAAAGVGFDDTLTGVQRCLRDYGLLK